MPTDFSKASVRLSETMTRLSALAERVRKTYLKINMLGFFNSNKETFEDSLPAFHNLLHGSDKCPTQSHPCK